MFFPLFARATATPIAARDGWPLLLPGLLAQGGIAEECLFRGYLFGHLRRERSFWRAAWLSVPPFVAVHLLLFTYMPVPVAAAATLLSLVMSFPLARLYDLGGGTIWAPALLHFVAQAGPKIAVVAGGQAGRARRRLDGGVRGAAVGGVRVPRKNAAMTCRPFQAIACYRHAGDDVDVAGDQRLVVPGQRHHEVDVRGRRAAAGVHVAVPVTGPAADRGQRCAWGTRTGGRPTPTPGRSRSAA